MPSGTGASLSTKERWVHLSFIEFQEDVDGCPMKTRKRLSQTSEDKESTENEDLPVSVTTMGPQKKKKPAMTPKQNVRRQTSAALKQLTRREH
jgi:hypothetical protein